MDSLDLSVDLAAPAERVFDVLADFAAFLDWNAYEGARIEIEGEGPGMVRTLVLPGFGRIGERLDELDRETRTLAYSLVEGTPIGMREYRARVCVEAVGADCCRLVWRGEFVPDEGFTGADVTPVLRQSYQLMSARLDEYLAAKPP